MFRQATATHTQIKAKSYAKIIDTQILRPTR